MAFGDPVRKKKLLSPKHAAHYLFFVLLSLAVHGRAAVVINEIHYSPDVKTEPVEFIELYNSGAAAVDLSGWGLFEGVGYTFPAGASIAAGGYRVIGQNPAAIQAKWGLSGVLGPWTGKLSGEADTIVLRNAQGLKIDEVAYQCGFPWPTSPDGEGTSMELINPDFDNNLGGNWRPSGDYSQDELVTLIPEESDWRMRKGLSEASNPRSAWRAPGFAEDSSWQSVQGPVGYGRTFVQTSLADMKSSYTTLYLRKTFTVPRLDAINNLVLGALYNDGINVWINGKLVARNNTPSTEPAYTDRAGSNTNDGSYRPFVLANPASFLTTGTNTIAVQLLNNNTTSTECYFDARLINTVSKPPTPGARNSVYNTSPPPCLRQVAHSPRMPSAGQPVTISVKATAPSGIRSVALKFQGVDPGNYIRLNDAAWRANWSAPLEMHDDGLNGDAVAGDSIYSVVIPGGEQLHRRLIRYRITAEAGNGKTLAAPYSDDPQYNFAYFCYNGIPAWSGAIDPANYTSDPAKKVKSTYDATVMNSLQSLHLVSREADVVNCQWAGPTDNVFRYEGAIVYDGEVYDHIFYRTRGYGSVRHVGKNKWKFRMNRGRWLKMRDNYGNPYPSRWRMLTFSTGTCPWWQMSKGTDGMVLNEALSMRLYELAGVPASKTTLLHYRVIDKPGEASPSDQYESDFWGLYIAIERTDGRFLDDRNLPDGNVFNMIGSAKQYNQGPTQPSNLSDVTGFINAYNKTAPYQPSAWWSANINVDNYFRYKTISDATNNADRRPQYNCIYYHHPLTNQWWVFPWDLDRSYEYGPGHYLDQEHWRYMLSYPEHWLAYQNTARELQDLLLNADEGSRAIDELAGFITKTSGGRNFVEANRAVWEYHPRLRATNHQGQFYINNNVLDYLGGHTFPALLEYMKRYILPESVAVMRGLTTPPYYGGKLVNTDITDPDIPSTPTLAYIGAPGYPANDLRFQCGNFADPQGAGTFGAMKWRLGEISDKSSPSFDPAHWQHYEVEPLWESAELGAFVNQITIPPVGLKVGHVYRARVKMKDSSGRWSHWSAPVQFTLGAPSGAVTLQDSLRLTELMFDPPLGDSYEFVELRNTGSSTIDLTGVAFTQGISYTFPAGATLAPGAYLLLHRAKDLAAFQAYYGIPAGTPLHGPYTGKLDNQGEKITLKNLAGGETLLSFTYDNSRGWALPPQGGGHSLVPLAGALAGEPGGSLDYCGNWKASVFIKGSPGRDEPPTPAGPLLNEFNAHTDPAPPAESNDWIELHNPAGAPVVLDGNWYLSDDVAVPRKYALGNRTIPAGGYLALDELNDFHTTATAGFGLNKAGERIVLSHLPGGAADRIVDSVRYEGQERGFSSGRHPVADPWWRAMVPSQGSANAPPPKQVVISEIMYHPDDDTTATEYIELFNATDAPVDMWTSDGGINSWRLGGEISFSFPPNTTLQPGEHLVITAFPPSDTALMNAFRGKYGVAPTARVLGPYTGGLSNRVGRVSLEKAQGGDAPDPLALLSWIVVDETIYFDQSPFPSGPDGGGMVLQRVAPWQAGMAPASWAELLPTPGRSSSSLLNVQTAAASGVDFTAATIRGTLVTTGGAAPTVMLYWGLNDGGTSASAWQASINLGPRGIGDVAAQLAGLALNTTYFYRCAAIIDGTTIWAPASYSFRTLLGYPLALTVSAGGHVARQPDKPYYLPGETVTLTAVADPGYRLGSWWLNGALAPHRGNPLALRIDQPSSVAVRFYINTASDPAWRGY